MATHTHTLTSTVLAVLIPCVSLFPGKVYGWKDLKQIHTLAIYQGRQRANIIHFKIF